MQTKKFVTIQITDSCNFRCNYCPQQLPNKLLKAKPINVDGIMNFLDSLESSLEIIVTGGEVFLVPNFVELSKRITEKYKLTVITNLSQDIEEFVSTVNLSNIECFSISLHLETRKMRRLMDNLREKIKRLKSLGVKLDLTQVACPWDFNNLVKEATAFAKEFEEKVDMQRFFGIFLNKTYPASYTAEQSKIFKPDYGSRLHKPTALPSFLGGLCNTGYSDMIIDLNGDVYRCYNTYRVESIGNIFKGTVALNKGPTTCPYEFCNCPFMGFRNRANTTTGA